MTCLRPDFLGRWRMKVLLNLITASRRQEEMSPESQTFGSRAGESGGCESESERRKSNLQIVCGDVTCVTCVRSNLDKLAKP